MQTPNTDIFGKAIIDFYENNYTEDIIVHSSIAEDDEIPVPYLFRDFQEMPQLEQTALNLATGSTLDVGCGAGSHALYLKEKGLAVTAIDTSQGATEICKKRGISRVFNTNLLDFTAQNADKFDTILLLMNGSGIFESIKKLPLYLEHLKTLLQEDGQILLDSSDISYMFEEEDGSYWRDAARDYYGEVTFSLSYKGEQSATFNWLYLDSETLNKAAKKAGFNCEIIAEGEHFDYLAKLTLRKEATKN